MAVMGRTIWKKVELKAGRAARRLAVIVMRGRAVVKGVEQQPC
jgi:hypothetical protein